MNKKIILLLLIAGCFFNEIVAQCPMCKASVESSQGFGGKSVGMGLNTGILLLLSSVYIIVITVGILWYKKYKRSLPQNV
jgi:hypothetical protein